MSKTEDEEFPYNVDLQGLERQLTEKRKRSRGGPYGRSRWPVSHGRWTLNMWYEMYGLAMKKGYNDKQIAEEMRVTVYQVRQRRKLLHITVTEVKALKREVEEERQRKLRERWRSSNRKEKLEILSTLVESLKDRGIPRGAWTRRIGKMLKRSSGTINIYLKLL